MREFFSKILFRTLILTWGAFAVTEASAVSFRECGTYVGEGSFRVENFKDTKKLLWMVNAHSESETRIHLGTYPAKDPDSLIGTNAILKFRILAPCEFSCEGQFVSIEQRLAPGQSPKSFPDLGVTPEEKLPCYSRTHVEKPRFVRAGEH